MENLKMILFLFAFLIFNGSSAFADDEFHWESKACQNPMPRQECFKIPPRILAKWNKNLNLQSLRNPATSLPQLSPYQVPIWANANAGWPSAGPAGWSVTGNGYTPGHSTWWPGSFGQQPVMTYRPGGQSGFGTSGPFSFNPYPYRTVPNYSYGPDFMWRMQKANTLGQLSYLGGDALAGLLRGGDYLNFNGTRSSKNKRSKKKKEKSKKSRDDFDDGVKTKTRKKRKKEVATALPPRPKSPNTPICDDKGGPTGCVCPVERKIEGQKGCGPIIIQPTPGSAIPVIEKSTCAEGNEGCMGKNKKKIIPPSPVLKKVCQHSQAPGTHGCVVVCSAKNKHPSCNDNKTEASNPAHDCIECEAAKQSGGGTKKIVTPLPTDNIAKYEACSKNPDVMKSLPEPTYNNAVFKNSLAGCVYDSMSSVSKQTKNNSFLMCPENKATNKRPCITKKYHYTITKSLLDVAKCVGVPAKELFPTFHIESRFHINRVNTTDNSSTAISQLTPKGAIKDILKNDSSYSNDMRGCSNKKLQSIFSQKVNIQNASTNKCSLTSADSGNPDKALLYGALYYKRVKNRVKNTYLANGLSNSKSKHQCHIPLKKGTKAYKKLENSAARLAYNMGASGIMTAICEYITKINELNKFKDQGDTLIKFNPDLFSTSSNSLVALTKNSNVQKYRDEAKKKSSKIGSQCGSIN